MAITNKLSNQFIEEYSKGEHDLLNDSLIAILLGTGFPTFDPATHLQYTNISANEIDGIYGYTQKTKALTTVSLVQVTNVMTLNADNLVWTASGGDMPGAVACAIINDTHLNDTIVCCIEFGATYQALDAATLTIDFSSGVATVTGNPT